MSKNEKEKMYKLETFKIIDKKKQYTYNECIGGDKMTDIEIASQVNKKDIREITKELNMEEKDIILYGYDKAKIKLDQGQKNGKLVLVTAINPTPYGEGKTTVSIGLGDALKRLDKNVIVTLRQPSMGPVFGMKGGATGGGHSQVIPMTDINLHFTGDFHAITSANNLLSAAIDNHIKNGNELGIKKVLFDRCLDVNDRELRNIILKERQDHFNITAASEMMALFCMATSLEDLKKRIGNIIIGVNDKNHYIYAKELKIEGALTVLLKDAFYPNLVQTLENTPVIVHGGPFANIAHGCNSIKATKLALSLSDYVITEAGFGSDLGAEKFIDIKCRQAKIKPDCIVLVATIKALKYNGEGNLEKGIKNLIAHIENLEKMSSNIIVCLNKYQEDTEEEIEIIKQLCSDKKIKFAISTAYTDGGEGAIALATTVLETLEKENRIKFLYSLADSIKTKIEILAKEIYRAEGVEYSPLAEEKINEIEQNKLDKIPICVAKTQYSLSDDKNKLGIPQNYKICVKDIKLYHGAGYITVLLGNIVTMPGLPKKPNYEQIDIDDKNNIIGIS